MKGMQFFGLCFFVFMLCTPFGYSLTKKRIVQAVSVGKYQIVKEVDFTWNLMFVSRIAPGHRWGVWGVRGHGGLLSFQVLGVSSESLNASDVFTLQPRCIVHLARATDKYGIFSTYRVGVSLGIKSYLTLHPVYQPFVHGGLLLEGTSRKSSVKEFNENSEKSPVAGFHVGGVFTTGLRMYVTGNVYLSLIMSLFVVTNPPKHYYYTGGVQVGCSL